jgi:Immunity protein 27
VKLRPDETDLLGKWQIVGGEVVADDTCKRIQHLISSYLIQAAIDKSGWEKLFKDPQDGRYWELTYPQGEMHGGGPPRLTCLSLEQAKSKYGDSIN